MVRRSCLLCVLEMDGGAGLWMCRQVFMRSPMSLRAFVGYALAFGVCCLTCRAENEPPQKVKDGLVKGKGVIGWESGFAMR